MRANGERSKVRLFRSRSRWTAAAVTLLVHSVLVIGIAWRSSPNTDEPAHLASGIYHWQNGRFDAFRVNPPFVRMWCTAPLAWFATVPQLTPPLTDDGSRLEWQLDDMLCSSWSYSELRRYLFAARLFVLPLAIAGGSVQLPLGSSRLRGDRRLGCLDHLDLLPQSTGLVGDHLS